jgi:hypothetical protein
METNLGNERKDFEDIVNTSHFRLYKGIEQGDINSNSDASYCYLFLQVTEYFDKNCSEEIKQIEQNFNIGSLIDSYSDDGFKFYVFEHKFDFLVDGEEAEKISKYLYHLENSNTETVKQKNNHQNKNTMEETKNTDGIQQDAETTTDQTLPVQPDEGVNDQLPKNAPEAVEDEEVGEDGKPAKKQGKGEMPSMHVNNQESAVENAFSNSIKAYKAVTRKIPEDKMAQVCAALEKLGCDLAKMKENGDLQRIQNGQKTEEVYEVNNPRIHKEGQTEKAKISFWLNENDEPIAYTHGVIQNPKFEKFMHYYEVSGERIKAEHIFTPEQQENLRTIGSAGELIELGGVLSIISRDRKTNRLYAVPENKTKIVNEILGVKLDPHQMAQLKNGKAIEVEGMKSKFDGEVFSGKVCYNAERGGLEVNAKKPFIIGKILGIEPTQEEKDILRDGGVLKIERTKEDGTALNTHVRLNQEQTRLQFSASGKFDAPTHQMTESQMQQYDSGKVVETNLIDKKGQPYVGFVKKGKDGRPLVSKDGTFQKKATAHGYQDQVSANNDGIAPDNETKKALNDGVVVGKGQSVEEINKPSNTLKNLDQKWIPKTKKAWKPKVG